MAQAVSSSNQAHSLGTVCAGRHLSIHNPMHDESPTPQKHHDLSRRNFMQAGLVNRYEIAWKDRGHHAGARDSQANAAERADNFFSQSTRQLDGSILPAVS